MLYYDRTDITKGIDLAKSNNNRGCMMCHYWFFNNVFKCYYFVCNSCHGLTTLCLDISNIAVIFFKSL